MEIAQPEDWDTLNGGCYEVCADTLSCGHPCTLTCHPFSHDAVICQECPKVRQPAKPNPYSIGVPHHSQKDSESRSISTKSWHSYAESESKRTAASRESYVLPDPNLIDVSGGGNDGASEPSTSSRVKATPTGVRMKYKETYVVQGEVQKEDCSKMNLLD